MQHSPGVCGRQAEQRALEHRQRRLRPERILLGEQGAQRHAVDVFPDDGDTSIGLHIVQEARDAIVL